MYLSFESKLGTKNLRLPPVVTQHKRQLKQQSESKATFSKRWGLIIQDIVCDEKNFKFNFGFNKGLIKKSQYERRLFMEFLRQPETNELPAEKAKE